MLPVRFPNGCRVTETANLQFERAQYEEGAATPVCALCQTPLYSSYFEANGETVCERCCFALRESRESGSRAGRLLRAAGAGFGAAIGGSILYWAILAMTGYEFGLIAIVVGFLVGGAVRMGSASRGGVPYQLLAMFLTYASIVSTFIPDILEMVRNQAGAEQPAGPLVEVLMMAAIIGIAFAAPFLMGLENIIGIVIIGIGLYEAWKINRKPDRTVTGPFRIEDAVSGATPAAP